MTDDEIRRRAAALAREFCKNWPAEVYYPNDLTMFYEKGYTQAAAECAGEIEKLSADVERLRGELTGAEERMAEWIADYQYARAACEELARALEKFANEDFRGNMPRGVRVAREALEKFKEREK